MRYNLIETLKNKVYLKRDRTRVFISSSLQKEIKMIQLKMAHEYKKKHRKKFHFSSLRASDYIAQIIREHRK